MLLKLSDSTRRLAHLPFKYIRRTLITNPERHVGPPISINNIKYTADEWTNVTPKILSYMGRNVYQQKNHPISIVRQQIVNYFYKVFLNSKGNPLFSVHENLCPVVTPEQNFDRLLIPKDHPSRVKSDCYYVNAAHLLRAHTTAHQVSSRDFPGVFFSLLIIFFTG